MTAEPLHGREPVPPGVRRRAGAPPLLPPWAGRVLREPLVHFFAAGLVLFAVAEHHRAQTDVYRIVVTPERVRELASEYRAEFGADPGPRTLAHLVDHYVDEEVLYREGLARKLDQDDEIVRRRIVQKMQFLEQDLAPPAEPTEAELAAWFQAHRAQYVWPATVSFSHVYFSDMAGGADAARARALKALAGLPDGVIRAPERGDSFPDLYDYSAFGPEQARRLFGDSEISRRLFAAPAGHWVGPFRSGYGWHLVRVQSVQAARPMSLEEARERVRTDLMAAREAQANARGFAALKARFTVVRADPGARP
jgi:hypothetical protein